MRVPFLSPDLTEYPKPGPDADDDELKPSEVNKYMATIYGLPYTSICGHRSKSYIMDMLDIESPVSSVHRATILFSLHTQVALLRVILLH